MLNLTLMCCRHKSVVVQATDEEELAHLQNLLAQTRAAEAEANRRASEATQKLASCSTPRDSQAEQAMQKVYVQLLVANKALLQLVVFCY